MADFKPSLTILDAGQESDRTQVRQFVNLLEHLARKHSCAMLLLAHPSLTGMNTGTGLSGSTDWNNGVRSRLYLQTPKASDGAAPNKNIRTLESMKSNYGERGGKIDLEWKHGLFVPVRTKTGFEKAASDQKIDEIFLKLLKKTGEQGLHYSPNSGRSYAPAKFAERDDREGFTSP